MGVNIERKNINLNECNINSNVSKWIEQDIIVPDTKPDAVKIINVTSTPYVTDIEVMDEKIKVLGKINYFIIYRVSDERFRTRGLFVTYPYTELIEAKGVKKGMDTTVVPVSKNVIYSLPNERKIAVKSEIIFRIRSRKQACVNLINHFSTDNKIECKMCNGTFNNIMKSRKSIIAAKEDVVLPSVAEDFFELLKVNTSIKNTEYKESYNKIMVKGDIEIKIIYLAESNEEPIKNLVTVVPFSSMIELESINDNSRFNIEYVMQDFNIRQNTEITTTKTLTVEYQIEAAVDMFEEEDIEYVEDFYSESSELNYDVNGIDVVKKSLMLRKTVDIRENLSNILTSEFKIVDYEADIGNVNVNIVGKEIKLEGNTKLFLITQNTENMEVDNKTIDILINQSLIIDEMLDTSKMSVILNTSSIIVNQNGNDIEVRLSLVANAEIEDVSNISIIGEVEEEKIDTSNLDGMNIYIVKPGDTLWNIAKKYKTSVDKIVRMNDISDPNVISVDQKIFIIR